MWWEGFQIKKSMDFFLPTPYNKKRGGKYEKVFNSNFVDVI
jgi:hypothetical protein